MNIDEIKAIFHKNSVPDHYYVFAGVGSGDCFGIEKTVAGWQIYYSERGRKSVFGKFDSEDEACRALMAEVDRRLRREFGRGLMP
jgi:hypothetical protein